MRNETVAVPRVLLGHLREALKLDAEVDGPAKVFILQAIALEQLDRHMASISTTRHAATVTEPDGREASASAPAQEAERFAARHDMARCWEGWAIEGPGGPLYVQYAGDEESAWQFALGWPAEEGIAHAKANGARAFQVSIVERVAGVTHIVPGSGDMVIALEALTRIASDQPFGLPGDDELLARRHYARDVIATLRRGAP